MKSWWKESLFLVGMVALLPFLIPALKQNLLSLRYLALVGGAKEIPAATNPDCSERWLYLSALMLSKQSPRDEDWLPLLSCDRYLPILLATQPRSRSLAEQAALLYPNNAQVWLWLGDIITSTDLPQALQAYQNATEVNSTNGLAWCRLGRSLESLNQPQKSAEAYLNCCRLGDPGVNGCWGAGRMYEKLSDVSSAIEAYRHSTWSTALQRADVLEKQLKP